MEHNHEHHNHSQKNNLAVPISIVIAGALIAIAVFMSNKAPSPVGAAGNPNPSAGQGATVESVAKAIKINAKDLAKCTESDKYVTKVSDSLAEGQSTGGNGTPWSIVVTKSGKKYPLSGAQPIDKIKALIDQAIKDEVATGDVKLNNLKPVTSADHIRGDINAPVKIVEFSDIDCPFCKRFHTTMLEVMNTYGKEGKVAWVYRHFPLTQLHPDAANKAEASECVAELGGNDKFWEFVDGLSK